MCSEFNEKLLWDMSVLPVVSFMSRNMLKALSKWDEGQLYCQRSLTGLYIIDF